MKIMIAVDASKHSDAAVSFITRMRWPPGSRMTVVSVVPPLPAASVDPMVPAPMAVPAVDPVEHERKELQCRTTIAHAEQVLRAAGFSAEGCLLEGDPREALVNEVKREHADLLVMGSRGHTGLARLLLGSVSSHLVTHAACSVLIVKGPVRA